MRKKTPKAIVDHKQAANLFGSDRARLSNWFSNEPCAANKTAPLDVAPPLNSPQL